MASVAQLHSRLPARLACFVAAAATGTCVSRWIASGKAIAGRITNHRRRL